MSEPDWSFGYWLRRRRKALDLTQAALAARAGCVVTTIKKLETGARQPSRQLAERLADALELSGDERALLLDRARSSAPSQHRSFPAPPSADAPLLAASARCAALPAPPGNLIGRARDLRALQALLVEPATRLLTLTGPGGVGKTRLAVQLAADTRDAFVDGVSFVDLVALTDPTLVPAAIARALGYESGTAPLTVLTRALQDHHGLLLLDNFEQVVPAASVVTQLLAAAPQLTILVTSRVALRLSAEHEYAVPPLALPPEQQAHDLDTYPAVELFIQRARAIQPHFVVRAEDATAIAAICRRLDGLPLAIELAARHVRLFAPPILLQQLTPRLPLLTNGPRDLPGRQQTLRATLDWSYQLLDPRERWFFAQLGVFVGGATLNAASTVCSPSEPGAALDAMMVLAEHSLLQATDSAGEPRFTMLETIREYALEQLRASGEESTIRTRHATYYRERAEAAVPHVRGPAHVHWLDVLDADHDNLRSAFDWYLESGAREEGLRLAGALHWFWDRRGYLDEGRARLRVALAAAAQSAAPTRSLLQARAWALLGAAALAFDQGDQAAVGGLAEESTALFRHLHDDAGLTLALVRLAFVRSEVEPAQAGALLAEAIARARAAADPWFLGLALFVAAQAALFGAHDLARARDCITEALPALHASGDPYLLAHGLGTLGLVELAAGDVAAAWAALEEGLACARTLRDPRSVALLAATTADVARCQAAYDRAAELYSESLALYYELGNQAEIPALLHNQAYVNLGRGDVTAAQALFVESLRRQHAAGNLAGVAEGLSGLAAVATTRGHLERAARLFGAAAAIRAAHPAPLWPAERWELERHTQALYARLPEPRHVRHWREGQHFSVEQAVAYAFAEEGPSSAQAQPARMSGLTSRERDVATLIAQGLTNRAIAEKLVISERTVERHIANMFAKLDVTSRTQIAIVTVQMGLAYSGT